MGKISRFRDFFKKWLIFTLRFDRKVVTLRHHISIIMVYNSIIGRNEEIRGAWGKVRGWLNGIDISRVSRKIFLAYASDKYCYWGIHGLFPLRLLSSLILFLP